MISLATDDNGLVACQRRSENENKGHEGSPLATGNVEITQVFRLLSPYEHAKENHEPEVDRQNEMVDYVDPEDFHGSD